MGKVDLLKKEYMLEDWSDSDVIEGKAQMPVINKAISLKYDPRRPDLHTTINSFYQDSKLIDELKSSISNRFSDIPEIDQEVKEQILSFTVRYLAQMQLAGDIPEKTDVLINELHEFIREVYKYHIPVYDLAFVEFDEMLKTRPTLQEVYIGRDGIYAFKGRLAQWQMRKERFNNAGLRPKYFVFPRIFINGLSEEEKKKYFISNGLSADQDIVLFDICFNGTVPESILKTLGFSEKEIDERIFLLSARKPVRQFKTIPNELGEAIADLQYSPKMEKRAVGVKTNKQNQKTEHIAEPTNPKDQFFFLVMEYIITKYYSS